MREICKYGSRSGEWKRGMVKTVGHRQTKGPATVMLHLNYRTTPRLYFSSYFFNSHSLIVWSELPEANILPSTLKATLKIASWCPFNVPFSFPVFTSQSLMFMSELPVTSVFPSGLKTMQ